MDASDLLRAVNAYLDGVEGQPPKNKEDAVERVKKLLRFRDEMTAFRFQNPRFAVLGLMRALNDAMRDMDKGDVRELASDLKAMRYAYELRKITYERARAAYIANRAALRIFESGLFSDLLPYLPYGGEYLAGIEGYGGTVLAVYKDLLENLRVFNDRLSTEVLVSTLLRKALSSSWEEILAEEKNKIPNYNRLLRYERIIRRYNLESITSNPNKLWELIQALDEGGFIVDGEVDPEILEGLRRKRAFRFSRVRSVLTRELRNFLFNYYLLAPERLRRNHPPFPGLPISPEPIAHILGDDAEILREKIYLESVLQLPSLHLAVALLHLRRGEAPEKLSQISPEDLRRAVDAVKTAVSDNPRVRRFAEFLRREPNGS